MPRLAGRTNRRILLLFLVISLPAITLPAVARAEDPPRYTALFTDGARVGGREIHSWHETKQNPRLDGRGLFDGAQVRALIDNRLPAAERLDEFIEFWGGDQLPARAMAYRSGTENPYAVLPPHLVVEPAVATHYPENQSTSNIRVGVQWVKRVVWHRRGSDSYRPSTVHYRDGRTLEYRALRWMPNGLKLLRQQGTMDVAFDELAELHLPQQDPWQAHFEQLAMLLPDGRGKWFQWETVNGIRLTGSLERFYARSRSGGDPAGWYHMTQPAWSLDPLWVAHRGVRARRYFEAHEAPLTLAEPSHVVQKSMLGPGWNWQCGRSVQGNLLKANGAEYAWGFGVHAHNELAFDLPESARKFRSFVALDESAGDGGCAQGVVQFGAANAQQKVFESKILVGSNEVLDTGWLDLGGQGVRRLTLTADTAHANRPPGADPFDIRDTFDWLEPQLEFDAELVKRDIREKARSLLPVFKGWDIVEGAEALRFANQLDHINQREPRFDLLAMAKGQPLTLKKQFTVGENANWLLVCASRPDRDATTSRIEVKIDGKQFEKQEAPVRRSHSEPDPLAFNVERSHGRDITVEIKHLPEGDRSLIDWRMIGLTDELPGLRKVFEDESQFVADVASGEGDVEPILEATDRYAGSACIKITPGERGQLHLPGLGVLIRDDPRLGEYRFIRFAWKKTGGGPVRLDLAHDGQWGKGGKRSSPTYRYVAGDRGGPELAVPIERKSPEEWVVVTRDLFGDFGTFHLTGLMFHTSDGEAALYDHIYLARSLRDFERIDLQSVAPNAREAEDTVRGRTPEDSARLREAMMQMREAEILARGRSLRQARERLEKALKLLTAQDDALIKRAKKQLERLEGKE